jgi:flagellar hook-basal body protein
MIRGIYSNAQAMSALMAKQDVQANNLANVNTHGFKKDRVIFDEFQEVLRGQQMSTPIARTSIDPKPGTLSRTDNTLDLAIQGDGFFRRGNSPRHSIHPKRGVPMERQRPDGGQRRPGRSGHRRADC